jgi:hypothetical protein
MSRVREDEVSKSFPFLGNIERVPERWDAIGICYIQLVFTDPIGFEWMCKASSIETPMSPGRGSHVTDGKPHIVIRSR